MRDEEQRIIGRLAEARTHAAGEEGLECVLAELRAVRRAASPSLHFVRVLRQLEAFGLTDLGRVEEAFPKLLEWFESETSGWRIAVALDSASLLSRVAEPTHGVLSAAFQMFQTEGLDPPGKAALLRELLRCMDENEARNFDDWEGSVRVFVFELGLDPASQDDLPAALAAFFDDQEYVAGVLLSGEEVDVSRLAVPWWRAKLEGDSGSSPSA